LDEVLDRSFVSNHQAAVNVVGTVTVPAREFFLPAGPSHHIHTVVEDLQNYSGTVQRDVPGELSDFLHKVGYRAAIDSQSGPC
jgi:hypothetical protein